MCFLEWSAVVAFQSLPLELFLVSVFLAFHNFRCYHLWQFSAGADTWTILFGPYLSAVVTYDCFIDDFGIDIIYLYELMASCRD